jgi:hypothetical protein
VGTDRSGIPNCVVQTNDELYVVNGRLARGYAITVSPDVFEQYRQGYRCMACHHFPQPEPFPDHCCEPYCRFPMKTKQLELLEFEHRGESDLVPDPTQQNIDERRRRLLENDDLWLPGLN